MNQDPHRALKMARRALAILEERAAGYTALTIPTHLQIELEDKREEVARLEAQDSGSVTPGAAGPARTIFDQRGQRVRTQINVAGDYHAAGKDEEA